MNLILYADMGTGVKIGDIIYGWSLKKSVFSKSVCGAFIAYVREGSYNTLLPATTSEEEEEENPSSEEEGDASLRRSAKKHGSSSPKKRVSTKVNDEVSCVLVTYSGNRMMRLSDFSCTIQSFNLTTSQCQKSGHWFLCNLLKCRHIRLTLNLCCVNVNHFFADREMSFTLRS